MGETAKQGRNSSKAGSKQVHQEKQLNEPGLDRVIQAQIGDKLRAMYGELVEQPVPDRLASILDRLSQGGGGGR
jgi:hypothetical protein